MKSTEFKKLIKQAVREVFQEEMKDIILESLKSSKKEQVITENQSPPPLDNMQKRDMYLKMIQDKGKTFTSNDIQTFNPSGPIDPANGTLPPGEVSLEQIIGIMK